MRRLSPAVAAAAALPLVLATAGSAVAAPTKTTTMFKDLTFVQWGGTAGYDLYTSNADGSALSMLAKGATNSVATTTNSPATEWTPVSDPASGFIAFQSSRGGDPDVWVQNMNTGTLNRVTSSTDHEAPGGWYHDASGAPRVVYCGSATCNQLFSIRPDGNDRRAVTDPLTSLHRFTVSPAGTVAVMVDSGDGTDRIYTFTIDPNGTVPTSAWTPVSAPPAGLTDVTPTFAPNGDLVFARNGNGVGRLMRIAAGATEAAATPALLMLQQGVSLANPSFSPGTGRLAYSVNTTTSATSGYKIAVATVGANSVVTSWTVLKATTDASQPAWRS